MSVPMPRQLRSSEEMAEFQKDILIFALQDEGMLGFCLHFRLHGRYLTITDLFAASALQDEGMLGSGLHLRLHGRYLTIKDF